MPENYIPPQFPYTINNLSIRLAASQQSMNTDLDSQHDKWIADNMNIHTNANTSPRPGSKTYQLNMKNNVQTSTLIRIVVLIAAFILVMFYNQSRASVLPVFRETIDKVAINFSNDQEKNELTIKVKFSRETKMQLFFFSPDGILIKEIALSSNKSITVKGLSKGYYLYECFDNDERMKSGSLVIK